MCTLIFFSCILLNFVLVSGSAADLSSFIVPIYSKSGKEEHEFVHCATIVGPRLLVTVLHDIKEHPQCKYFFRFQDKYYLVKVLLEISDIDIAFLQISSFSFPLFIRLSITNLKILDNVIFVDINSQNISSVRLQRGAICSNEEYHQYTSGYTTYGGSCGGVVVSSDNMSEAIGIHSEMEHESKSSSSSDTSPSQPSKAKKSTKPSYDELHEALQTEKEKRRLLKRQKGSNPIFVKVSAIFTFIERLGYRYDQLLGELQTIGTDTVTRKRKP